MAVRWGRVCRPHGTLWKFKARFDSWAPSLLLLRPHGINAVRGECEHMFVPPRYSEADARAAVAATFSYSEALRALGMCSTGNAWRVLKKYTQIWDIPTEHFRPNGRPPVRRSLEELLVVGSVVKSATLKERLYEAGMKDRRCELCGQGEEWLGRRMSLILDHINGEHRDNRLENLRIVCANCNATLDTHCGRNARQPIEPRECARCGNAFEPKYEKQRYCSRTCGSRWDQSKKPVLKLRRAERPPLEELLRQIGESGYEAVGRRHGVSGNAIRNWIRFEGVEPPAGPGRDFNPPPPPPRALGDDQAREALMLLANGMSNRKLAIRMGVSVDCIKDLRAGRTYRHIERPDGLAA